MIDPTRLTAGHTPPKTDLSRGGLKNRRLCRRAKPNTGLAVKACPLRVRSACDSERRSAVNNGSQPGSLRAAGADVDYARLPSSTHSRSGGPPGPSDLGARHRSGRRTAFRCGGGRENENRSRRRRTARPWSWVARGAKQAKPVTENSRYAAFARRILRAYARLSAHALQQLTETRVLTRRRWRRVLYRIPRPRKGLRPRLDRQLPATGQPGRPW